MQKSSQPNQGVWSSVQIWEECWTKNLSALTHIICHRHLHIFLFVISVNFSCTTVIINTGWAATSKVRSYILNGVWLWISEGWDITFLNLEKIWHLSTSMYKQKKNWWKVLPGTVKSTATYWWHLTRIVMIVHI